jgi:hypothetical protein
MIIFKTVLTDKQIEDYKRPEGTKTYECGAGLNCAFCALKMLGVYNPNLEEKSKTCGPRFRSGKPVRPEEYITAIKQVIADMTEEHHEFAFAQEIGDPSVSLAKIAGNLQPLEACYFIYGRYGVSTHAVVLRKNREGEVELIDPQRGSDDVGKEFGFTAERAAELGVELTPQYYRVRGIPEIEAVMVEQSVFFKYWPSKEALFEDLPHFVIACLMVDSVVGLKMLIDDRDTSKLMDVEDMPTPTPTPNPPMDVEAESEMEMEGGGTETIKYPMTPEKGESEDDLTTLSVKPGERLDQTSMKKLFLSIQETATANVDPVLFQTIVKLLGKPDGEDVITNLLELPEEEFEEEEDDDDEQMGGAAVMITPEEYRSQIQDFWTKNQAEDRVNSTFYLMKKALELHNVERNRISKKGILKGYESPNPTGQCKKVGGDAVGNICWLCGGFAPYSWEKLKPETQMGICKLFFNRKECEHILPVNLMYFLKTLVNTELPPTTEIQKKLQKLLYDNSCRLCNGKKDNGLYIRTQTIDGNIEPHVPNILSDVLTFFTVYGSTTGPCESGNGNMGDVPSELGSVGSLVHVKGKYYPNVIRAQLSPGFVPSPTKQSTQADKAKQLSGPAQILSGIQTNYPEAYQKLTTEPGITEPTTSTFGNEVLPQVTSILKGKLHTAESLEGPFKEIARVDQKVAVDWILRRFCIIYDRIRAICNVLNSPEGKALWNTQTDSILLGNGEPMKQIKALAVINNGPKSESTRLDRTTRGSEEESAPEDEEMMGQKYPIEPPPKRQRRGGKEHLDISIHRGGRRVVDVDL